MVAVVGFVEWVGAILARSESAAGASGDTSPNCLLNSFPRKVWACIPNLLWRNRASRGYQVSGKMGELPCLVNVRASFAWELRNVT